MKRRVIQIGNSTQLVSLPRKWALQYGIKKGDEVDIAEQGSTLLLSLGSVKKDRVVELDVSNLDNVSIIHYIQSAYKSGYDEIKVTFTNDKTLNVKTDQMMSTMEAVRFVVHRLIGSEIISQRQNYCIIRDISQTAPNEFDNVLRRVFILLRDMAHHIAEGAEKNDKQLLRSVQEQHDTMTRFVAFCLRLLNKRGQEMHGQTPVLFHIIASLDKIADIYKHVAREIAELKEKPSKQLVQLIKSTNVSLDLYGDLYYKFSRPALTELSKNRRRARSTLREVVEQLTPLEATLASKYMSMLDTILDITEWRMALAINAPG